MSNEKITITTSAIKLIYKTTNGRPIGRVVRRDKGSIMRNIFDELMINNE